MVDRHSSDLVQINIRLKKKTADKLKELAASLETTQADLVDYFINLKTTNEYQLKPIFAFRAKKPKA